jgi:hypothetical protein
MMLIPSRGKILIGGLDSNDRPIQGMVHRDMLELHGRELIHPQAVWA